MKLCETLIVKYFYNAFASCSIFFMHANHCVVPFPGSSGPSQAPPPRQHTINSPRAYSVSPPFSPLKCTVAPNSTPHLFSNSFLGDDSDQGESLDNLVARVS